MGIISLCRDFMALSIRFYFVRVLFWVVIITQEAVSSIIHGVLIVPKYRILFYHWSVYLHRWDITPRTLFKQHPNVAIFRSVCIKMLTDFLKKYATFYLSIWTSNSKFNCLVNYCEPFFSRLALGSNHKLTIVC